jgi:hypothetical protein
LPLKAMTASSDTDWLPSGASSINSLPAGTAFLWLP